MELYQERVKEIGKRKADRLFRRDVLQLFRKDIVKPADGTYRINTYGMFKNSFKITWRSLWRQKTYSIINIGGLAVGLTCFLLIFLYVQHELSYDKFYPNANQIHRVYQKQEGNFYLGTDNYATTPVALAPTLIEDFPEVKHATRMNTQESLLSIDDNHYYEKGIRADVSFFDVFEHPLLQGDRQTALKEKHSIILSETLAKKIFGEINPMGKTLTYQNKTSYTVTGIIEDLPSNSSIKFSYLTSISSSGQYAHDIKEDQWGNNDYHTFFSLSDGASPEVLESKFPTLLDSHPETRRNPKIKRIYLTQPLADLHLADNLNGDLGLKGNPKYLYLFSVIALIVLVLACMNYMNLAIARSIKRAREVGLRKVMGAFRKQLIGQFIGESVLIAFLALLLAIGLTLFFVPVFGGWLDRPIAFDLFENTYLIPILLLLVISVGILSGSYPAFFMSSLKPAQVLKGKIDGKFSSMRIQRWLIAIQYATSIVLIVGSLVTYYQFDFIQNKELGYTKEHILTVSVFDRALMSHLEDLKAAWATNPNIISVTATAELPTNVTSGTLIHHLHETKEEAFPIYRSRMNYNYLEVFDIELLAGRDFSPEIVSDLEDNYIINESAANALGWTPQEAIGKQFNAYKTKTVIGVIKDFHMHSMHLEIAPLLLMMEKNYFTYIALKVRGDNLNETILAVEEAVQEFSPFPFEYKFLDDQFDQLYKADTKLGEMVGVFTFLAIIIASLGLFGLAAYTTSQRVKEIGIRKVLGASVGGIVAILAKDFLKLIVLGFLVAIPIAWYVTNDWLQSFAYRIEITWWMFALPGLAAILIALLTISSQSIKAALANPIDCLHDE